MAERRPLVVIGGDSIRLPDGDLLPPSPLIPMAGINGYTVLAGTAIDAGASVVIPLDGVPRRVDVSVDLSIDVVSPVLPDLGEVKLWLIQDAIGGHTISLPAAWNFHGGAMGAFNLDPNGLTHLRVVSNPAGGVDAAVASYKPVP